MQPFRLFLEHWHSWHHMASSASLLVATTIRYTKRCGMYGRSFRLENTIGVRMIDAPDTFPNFKCCDIHHDQVIRMSKASMWVDSMACKASRWWQVSKAHLRGALCMLRTAGSSCIEGTIHWQTLHHQLDCHLVAVSSGSSLWIISVSKRGKSHQDLRAADCC